MKIPPIFTDLFHNLSDAITRFCVHVHLPYKHTETTKTKQVFEKTASKKNLIQDMKNLNQARKQYESIRSEPLASSAKAKQEQAEKIGQALLNLVEKEVLLALEIGIKPKEAGDTSSSFFLCDLNGKKIAIFKPDDFGPRGKKNPKLLSRIKTWISKNISNFSSIRHSRQRVGEEFAYLASKSIGHMTVPPTKIIEIRSELLFPKSPLHESMKGSLQLLVDDVQSAGSYLQKNVSPLRAIFSRITRLIAEKLSFKEKAVPYKPTLSENNQLPQKAFFSFAVLDFLSGQIDRHWENWMICIPKTKTTLEKLFSPSEDDKYIVSIDNGASLPIAYPGTLESKYQYQWDELPVANTLVAELVKEMPFREGWQEKIIEDLLTSSLNEDLHDAPPEIQRTRSTIQDLLRSFTQEKRIPLPSLEKVMGELSNALAMANNIPLLSPKLLSRLSKLSLQILSMKERIAVLEIFFNPPKEHESLFTLKKLAQLRTKEDYERFWVQFRASDF